MSEKIDRTLKNLAAGMSKANTQNTSNAEVRADHAYLAGDPDCPHCHGLGYLREDLPLGHPDFGKLQICTCRQGQISRQVHQRLYALSNLGELSHLTFERFKPRGRVGLRPYEADSLEQAFSHARQFAQALNGWLLLQGKNGCGKTHLAAAIANFAVDLGVPTLFITVPDMLDTLRFAYGEAAGEYEDRFDEVRSATLLVLDDFGTQNATAWAQEKLFQILNYRYINRMPTVVTTNLSLEDIEGRIRSRLEDPELVTQVLIKAPDFRNPARDMGDNRLSSLDLLHDRTFASFELRKEENLPAGDLRSLEKAFTAAQDYARRPQGWVVFTGPYGCGKTHLAAAIANYQADLGRELIFVVVPDLLDHLRATFSPTSGVSLDRRFEEVRTTPLLLLDDLGTQTTTAWAKEKVYQLFNYRYNAELPTVITTSSAMEEWDPRLKSRFLDERLCNIHAINVPPFRGAPRPKRGRRVK